MSRWLGAGLLASAVLFARPASAAPEDPWLGPDKGLHFGVSAAIAGVAYGASTPVVAPRWQRATLGASVALAAGGLKELIDLRGPGRASWRDFTWDVAGTATGVGLALLIDTLWPRRKPQTEIASVASPLVVRF